MAKIQYFQKCILVIDVKGNNSLNSVLGYLRDILFKLEGGHFPKWWLDIVETIETGFLMKEITGGTYYNDVV